MLENKVTTPIFYDDVIKFGFKFTTGSVTPTDSLMYDVAECIVQINTKNDKFWT